MVSFGDRANAQDLDVDAGRAVLDEHLGKLHGGGDAAMAGVSIGDDGIQVVLGTCANTSKHQQRFDDSQFSLTLSVDKNIGCSSTCDMYGGFCASKNAFQGFSSNIRLSPCHPIKNAVK